MRNIHEISCKLQSISQSIPNYRKHLRGHLVVLLTKVDGHYPWESFVWTTADGGERSNSFKTFPEYLAKWSSFTLDDLKKLFSDDLAILNLLDDVEKREPGQPSKERMCDNITHSHNNRQGGTSKDTALRRLRKDAPELLERVIAGELSPHAAMLQAGFRRPMLQVPADDYDAAIRKVNAHYKV
jgi:hypothetical protein